MPVPPQVPLIKFFSGDKDDLGLIEFWSSETASYQPLDLGSVHPNTRDYPGFKLVKQQNLPNDQRFVIRIWAKDGADPLWFGYSLKYSGDANAYPIFVRQFRELRKTYTPRTKGQPLTGVYQLKPEEPGSGYIPGSFPAVTGTNGGGTGLLGHAIVAPDGTVADLILDESGTGYTSSPNVVIEPPPTGGDTATGTALVQPATALLVAEEAQEFPDDSEFNSIYLSVVRVYETLPGPLIPSRDYDPLLGFVQMTRRAVANTGQVGAQTAVALTTYEGRNGSSIVLWEIAKTWSDGTGSAGNPAYPILVSDLYENNRGAIHQTSQVTTDVSSVGSLAVSAGIATLIRYEPYQDNPALRRNIVETWAVPAVALPSEEPNEDGTTTVKTRTMSLRSAITEGETVSGGFWTRTSAEAYSETISWKITEVRPLPGNAIASTKIDQDGTVIVVTKTLKQASTITSSETLLVSTRKEAVTALVAWEVVETRPSFPTLYDYDIDPDTGQTIRTSYQVVDVATAGTASSSSGVITRYKHIDSFRSMKIIETHSTPADYDEQRFGAYPFPNLWDGAFVWTPECGAFATGFRGSFSTLVNMRITNSYTGSKQTFDGLALIPKTFMLGKVALPSDLITDSGTFTYSGTCSGSVSFGASDPDYSTYLGLIGTEQLITGESVRTRSGLYRNKEVFVTMR